jgi:hypothetical protein
MALPAGLEGCRRKEKQITGNRTEHVHLHCSTAPAPLRAAPTTSSTCAAASEAAGAGDRVVERGDGGADEAAAEWAADLTEVREDPSRRDDGAREGDQRAEDPGHDGVERRRRRRSSSGNGGAPAVEAAGLVAA